MGGVIIKNSYNDLFEYVNTINNENKLQTPKRNSKTLALCINILVITLLISTGLGIKFLIDKNNNESHNNLLLSQQNTANEIKQNIENKKEEITQNINKDFRKLKQQNSDIIGWLYIPETNINMPIVQTTDNVYYLTHDINKESNETGWAFIDKNNTLDNLNTNTIIYGNTYKNTSTLNSLKSILDTNYNENNNIITLDTEKERLTFEIFSIYKTDKIDEHLKIEFNNNDEYQTYLNKSLERSIKNFNKTKTTENKILTLVTCYEENKEILIVQAKLIRPE